MAKFWGTDDLTRYTDTAQKNGRLQKIIKNSNKILDWRLNGDEENALIIADTETSPVVYNVMAGVLLTFDIEPTTIIITQRDAPNNEPPSEVAKAATSTDLIINMCTYTITQSDAIQYAREEFDVDYILLANSTEDSLTRGAVDADPREVEELTKKVSGILQNGEHVEVTSEYGTDVHFTLDPSRKYPAIGYPTGEAPTCPDEDSINGTIVHDSFMMGVGLLNDPISWEMVDGVIDDISGGREAEALREYIDQHGDKNSYRIGEFAVGTNSMARPNGNYLESKQVGGSVHFALGNGTVFGGQYESVIHLDGVQLKPTVAVDDEIIIRHGEFLI